MTAPASKADLMNQINETWDAYLAAVTAIDPTRALEPGADGWSVRDQVAHVSAWERSVLALLRGESRAAAVGVAQDEYEAADIDQINARIHASSASLSLDEALARAEATHRDLLEELDRLSWEELHRPYSYFQQDRTPREDRPVIDWVLGDTTEHYAEHRTSLERFRDELR